MATLKTWCLWEIAPLVPLFMVFSSRFYGISVNISKSAVLIFPDVTVKSSLCDIRVKQRFQKKHRSFPFYGKYNRFPRTY